MSNNSLNKLKETLEADARELVPRFPSAARFLLNEKRVKKALKNRFNQNRTLLKIKELPYDFATGLLAIYFEFSTGAPLALQRDTLLVLSDSHTKVVALIDPFDPDHPNHVMPGLQNGRLPFVLARPSLSQAVFRDDELANETARTEDFLAQVGVAALQGGGGGGRDPSVNTRSLTTCLRVVEVGFYGATVREVIDEDWDDCDDGPIVVS